jgi:osmotically-inducible protein OsmY
MANDQLSASAKNVKIITVNGKVTLRGPVNTDAEKEAIANAVQQSGVTDVDNQIEVKTTNK